MRIIYSKKIHDVQEIIRPYLVLDKDSMRLVVPDDTPDEIKEMYKNCVDIRQDIIFNVE